MFSVTHRAEVYHLLIFFKDVCGLPVPTVFVSPDYIPAQMHT